MHLFNLPSLENAGIVYFRVFLCFYPKRKSTSKSWATLLQQYTAVHAAAHGIKNLADTAAAAPGRSERARKVVMGNDGGRGPNTQAPFPPEEANKQEITKIEEEEKKYMIRHLPISGIPSEPRDEEALRYLAYSICCRRLSRLFTPHGQR